MEPINKEQFEKIKTDSKPAVIDFFATWCGPCKLLAPTFEKVANKFKDQVNFAKVDVDQSSDLAQQFGVMSVPTLLFLKDGEEVDRKVGNIPEPTLEQAVKNLLN